MRKPKVLDASALYAYYRGSGGYELVADALEEADATGTRLRISAVSWGEVYYKVLRHAGKDGVGPLLDVCRILPVEVVPVDLQIAREAGDLRNRYGLHFADAIAAAIAKLAKGVLLTADTDFAALAKELRILWLKD
jgi:predicted nucleic acid-binding protein